MGAEYVGPVADSGPASLEGVAEIEHERFVRNVFDDLLGQGGKDMRLQFGNIFA